MPETLIIANSKGARNVSADGSAFDVIFDVPIKTGGDPHIKVLSSTIWYTFPNVKTGVNDQLIIKHGAGLTLYSVLTIPQGLYGIEELNAAVQHQIQSQNLARFLAGKTTLTIGADFATGRASISISIDESQATQHVEIDWQNSSIAPLLGFTQNVALDAASGIFSATFFGNAIASLSPVDSLQIHCSAARGSVVAGQTGSDTLASIQVDARPGYQILYQPPVTPRVSAPAFTNGVRSMRMRLTDQDGAAVNTQQEYWTATLLLEW